MNILITGAGGFVGKNLVAALENIKNGCDRTRGDLTVDDLLLYDLDSDSAALADYCAKADFVFHLAGVNRPADPAEFMTGNRDLTAALLQALEQAGNTCPVMLSTKTSAYSGSGATLAIAALMLASSRLTTIFALTPQNIASLAIPMQAPMESKSGLRCPMISTLFAFAIVRDS